MKVENRGEENVRETMTKRSLQSITENQNTERTRITTTRPNPGPGKGIQIDEVKTLMNNTGRIQTTIILETYLITHKLVSIGTHLIAIEMIGEIPHMDLGITPRNMKGSEVVTEGRMSTKAGTLIRGKQQRIEESKEKGVIHLIVSQRKSEADTKEIQTGLLLQTDMIHLIVNQILKRKEERGVIENLCTGKAGAVHQTAGRHHVQRGTHSTLVMMCQRRQVVQIQTAAVSQTGSLSSSTASS